MRWTRTPMHTRMGRIRIRVWAVYAYVYAYADLMRWMRTSAVLGPYTHMHTRMGRTHICIRVWAVYTYAYAYADLITVDLPAEHGRVRGHAWTPTTARCTSSRHARSRGSRRPSRSLWVPWARPRLWWALRLPFRRRPVPVGPKRSKLAQNSS